MNKGYMTTKEVCEHFKFSRVTLYRMMKKSDFPEPLIRGDGKSCKWSLEQIELWEKQLNQPSNRNAD